MGESGAGGEGILCGFVGEVRCVEDDNLPIKQNNVRLHIFYGDKLICVHSKSVGYNKCKFNFNLEAALMVKSINGEKNYD
jgi:hypothetical protein